jgi:HEAT repeat protein
MAQEIRNSTHEDLRPTEELVRLAIAEDDEDARWNLIGTLQLRGTREVLDAAASLIRSTNIRERQAGVDILAQLGAGEQPFAEDRFNLLAEALSKETDADVLQAIAIAFGHLRDPRCIDLVLPLASHPDCDVRYGVVHSLSGLNDPRAIAALINLSADEDEDIRDWATFGLGTLTEVDTPELREALCSRLADGCLDARAEAIAGLARRKDLRALEPVLEELSLESVDELAIEAAEELADLRLLHALLALKDRWSVERDGEIIYLEKAIAACTPQG